MEKEKLNPSNTNIKKSKLHTSTKIWIVVLCIVLIPLIAQAIYYSTPAGKGDWYNFSANVIVDNVEWTVKFQEHSYTKNVKIIKISSSSSYNERTSEYYTTLATRYGSADVFIIHEVSKVGKAIDNETFLIEETEVVKNGFDETEVLNTKTISYEEKINNILPKIKEILPI